MRTKLPFPWHAAVFAMIVWTIAVVCFLIEIFNPGT